tara:strand:+ start:1022 stop:1228 length:207 start_codon:yes stop_codon:yes gene_type:complete
MVIVHVFQENSQHDQDGHMEDWFGNEPPSGEPDDAVCACGARMVYLDKKATVAGVYHYQHWSPWKELS